MPPISELLERRTAVLEQLDNPELTEEQHTAALAEAEEVRVGIEAYNERVRLANERRSALEGVTPSTEIRRAGSQGESNGGGHESRWRSAGEMFTSDARYLEARQAGFPRGSMLSIDIPVGTRETPGPLELRTLIDSGATQGGAFQRPPLQPVVPRLFADRQLQVADLWDRGTTTNSSVDYVEDQTAAGAGATAAETAEGVAKPQAAFLFAQKTVPVATIAHWVPMTRQSADDNQQLQSYIDGRLRFGLLWRLDSQSLNGNGTTPNMRGLYNASGINTYAPGAAEARVISVRKAKTLASNNEYMSDGVVLNPADWELVDLSTDANGMFRVVPNVQGDGPRRLWGMTGVETTATASGTGAVGAFRMAATLWDRQQANVILGYVNDDLIKNQFTLLAELRAALTVFRPKAFTKITFNGTT
jgi:HK97 family phage major capsid protein